MYNKCINCFFTTNSNLLCHFSLAIYVTWFLYNPRLNDCKCSFSSKFMNTSFKWNTIWSRILIVKKHTIEEDALEDWFFWSCMQKKRFTEWWPNKSIGVCLEFFFSYRAVNFFLLISFSFTQGDTADTIARYARPKLMPFFVRGEPSEPRITGHPVRKSPSLHGRKPTPTPKFLSTAGAYFVCHTGPNFQVSLIFAFIGCP